MPGIVSNNPKLLDPTYPLFTDLSLPGVAVEGNPDMLQALSTNLPSPAVAKKIALVCSGAEAFRWIGGGRLSKSTQVMDKNRSGSALVQVLSIISS